MCKKQAVFELKTPKNGLSHSKKSSGTVRDSPGQVDGSRAGGGPISHKAPYFSGVLYVSWDGKSATPLIERVILFCPALWDTFELFENCPDFAGQEKKTLSASE